MLRDGMAPAPGPGGDTSRRSGERGHKYISDALFAQLLELRVSDFRTLVNKGVLPVPCRSTAFSDYWFQDTAYRVLHEVDAGVIWIGMRRRG
jgi:hypothetical protein